MKRPLTYVGQQVYEWAFSAPAQYAMTALAKVCQSMFGTTTTVNGLACSPTSPASMAVLMGPGEIYQMASLEATVAGTLPVDTTHQILKQGIQLDNYTTATFSAPTSSGQSVAYLIQAQYQDSDISIDPTTGTTPVVLQFYNSTTPATPWAGPNDSGSTSTTFRDGVIAYSIKAGVAATTGSQVTPTPDSGYVGLSVVTVAYGQTTITTANISAYANAPRLSDTLLNQIQARALLNGSTANRFSVADAQAATDAVNLETAQALRGQLRGVFGFNASQTLTATHAGGYILFYGSTVSQTITLPTWSSISANDEFHFYNGASVPVTIAPPSGATGITAKIVQPGESYDIAADAVANGFVTEGGTTTLQSIPTMPAPLGGTPRMSASAALGATTATFTDDFVHVTSSVGLPGHKIANLSAALDLTKLNVLGGMIGSAPTAGQFVGVYAAFNPSTGAYGVVGFSYAATAAIPSIATLVASYLAGFTETSLIGIVPAHQTTAGQFDHFNARGRYVRRTAVTMVNVSASVPSLTSQSTGIAIPANAIKMKGNMFASSTSTSASSNVLQLASDGTGLDANISANGTTTIQEPYELLMQTANTFFYSNSASVGTPQSQVTSTGYEWA